MIQDTIEENDEYEADIVQEEDFDDEKEQEA